MRPPSSLSLLALPVLLASLADAASFDCSAVVADKKKFNFYKLGGPHSVTVQDDSSPPSIINTTWTLDLCANLKKDGKVDSKDQCPGYTRVCGISKLWNPVDDPGAEHAVIQRVIPVAGHLDGSHTKFEPTWKRLKSSSSDDEGLALEFNGGEYGKRNQKALINLICDKSRTGDEGSKLESRSTFRREDDDDDDEDRKPKQDPNSSLQYVSYDAEDDKSPMILRLDWRTKYACEDFVDDGDDEDNSKTGGWGFFTWFILILFLGTAAYLIFGSWLNYNRYGARGWDLLPHGDTIRDLPYLFKDWSRSVVDTVTGGHSRGGYSAV